LWLVGWDCQEQERMVTAQSKSDFVAVDATRPGGTTLIT
jgi:hypothetical protein